MFNVVDLSLQPLPRRRPLPSTLHRSALSAELHSRVPLPSNEGCGPALETTAASSRTPGARRRPTTPSATTKGWGHMTNKGVMVWVRVATRRGRAGGGERQGVQTTGSECDEVPATRQRAGTTASQDDIQQRRRRSKTMAGTANSQRGRPPASQPALSVNILHEIVEVAQERKCIQDGNSVAVLLLTAAATAAHCAQQCRAVLVTVVRVIPKRKPSKFFQKQNDKFDDCPILVLSAHWPIKHAIKSQTHDLVPNHMTTHDCKWGRDPPRGMHLGSWCTLYGTHWDHIIPKASLVQALEANY
ncbi:hypothetical protein BJ912DRAFT_1098472 [Pholiota molesta]|nr:hypothetical protein BJ912DRAFT_1098472 [Pholiota molesta]